MSIRRRDEGQALSEFALVAPLFFLLIFGVIQFGITFGGQIGLGNAAREIARYTSTLAANSFTSGTIKPYVDSVLARSIPAFNNLATTTMTYCYYANPTTPVTYSQKVIVTITYPHTLFVPLAGAVLDRIDGSADNRFTASVREEMKVETQPIKSPTGTNCASLSGSVGVNP
jgi:Flp pilus assembly protein TadG